ncbi:hypothetical protein R3P38DRAFT_2843947 [Favolaschia claudopus]|uniref:Uncharacterized protein n=1 Tax=Favolaschia claudopus TaxID=2862362 RepID=A0AAW0E1K0_9AGAR
MSDAAHTPVPQDSSSTIQKGFETRSGSTPRISSPSSFSFQQDRDEARTPPAISGYSGRLTQPALRRLNEVMDDDDARSVKTDITDVSVIAQAGTSAPGSPAFSADGDMDVEMDDDGDNAQEASDASQFWDQDHDSATIPDPPSVHIEPRTHPLSRGDSTEGGVPSFEDSEEEMDEDRADAELEAMDDRGDFSDDDAEGAKKPFMKRVKGRAKIVGGKVTGNSERVNEGEEILGKAS